MYVTKNQPSIHKGLVTTIIPVFNRPKLIKEAVTSVLAQSYQSLQIIIVDDGSTDQTPRILRRLARKSSNVTVLTQQNQGPGVARQLGLDHAEGEYIQFLDSDDVLLPSKFTLQVAALKKNRKAVAAYGKTELIEYESERKYVAWKRTGQKIDSMFPQFLHERWWGTSSPLYRHRALRLIGPILPLINEEDWEYDCRLAAHGGEIEFVDHFVSIQTRHGNHLSEGGSCDPKKLRDRCAARESIYRSALKARLADEELAKFSKASFFLARECAAKGLSKQANDMLRLSIKANNGPTQQLQTFTTVGNVVGWRAAAMLAKIWQGSPFRK